MSRPAHTPVFHRFASSPEHAARAAAHRLLDRAQRGENVPQCDIDEALRTTGDLEAERLPAARAFAGGRMSYPIVDGGLGLSTMEVDILRAAAPGLTRNQIALVLNLSPHTINDHMRSIYRKLKTCHMATAVLKTERAGLLEGVRV